MDVLHLIDRLEEMVGEARRLPIGTGVVMDRRRLLDLVDQLRAAVPSEVKEARDIIARRDEVLSSAEEEARIRIARADEEVERRLSETEIVRAAEMRAQLLVQEAEAKAERLLREAQADAQSRLAEAEKVAAQQMDDADRYALEMLRRLEEQLQTFIGSVRSGIDSLEQRPEAAETHPKT